MGAEGCGDWGPEGGFEAGGGEAVEVEDGGCGLGRGGDAVRGVA